ncbi:hypothetical protein FOL47_009223 [Perkinsus chesapeaki]|uniref:Uncharacterized protein n=1 Tax=Perkinsus chesapeaki TaxID=330153 RepID=A0A7J6L9R9_PERCH|nr:hypothetical protein FOL47_009223 [Perkinsus chesapeaki]
MTRADAELRKEVTASRRRASNGSIDGYRNQAYGVENHGATGGYYKEANSSGRLRQEDGSDLNYSSSDEGSEEGSVRAQSRPVSCRVVPVRDRGRSSLPGVDNLRSAKNKTQGEVAYRAECRREILNKYADLLRVGELWINGQPTRWQTGGFGKEGWFDHFELAFRARLRELERAGLVPPCGLADEITLIYWVCKLTSINYCLWEICSYIRESLEKSRMIILETFDPVDPTESILVYSLTLVGAATGSICMSWTKGNNIMYVNRHGERKCKGTVKTIETQVPLRLLDDSDVETFKPIYDVDMELIVNRGLGDKIASRLNCFNTGVGKFTDSSSLVSATEPLMPRGSSMLRELSYPTVSMSPEEIPLFEGSRGRRTSTTYTSDRSCSEDGSEERFRKRAEAQQRLHELQRYRRYIKTSSGELIQDSSPSASRSRRVSSGGATADSQSPTRTPRYSRGGSQQSIPDEFDLSDDGRDHLRNFQRKNATPDTASTAVSKKSVTFARNELTDEGDRRTEARRRLEELKQYRRYIKNQQVEAEDCDAAPSRVPPSW